MKQTVSIEGKKAQLTIMDKDAASSTVERLRGEEFIPHYVRHMDLATGTYVIELPPGYRNIRNSGVLYRIPVPWQIYICQVDKPYLQFFTRTDQLRSLDDMLHFPHISNVYRDGSPCGGVRISDHRYSKMSPIQQADMCIRYLWDSGFQGGFYLNGEGAYGSGRLPHNPQGSLLPKEFVQKFGEKMYVDHRNYGSASYYEWLETLTPEDVLGWTWTEALTLRKLLPTVKDEDYFPRAVKRLQK